MRWPDGSARPHYSPSLVMEEYLTVGSSYPVDEFVRRSREAPGGAGDRVREKDGFPCSRAGSSPAAIEQTAAGFVVGSVHAGRLTRWGRGRHLAHTGPMRAAVLGSPVAHSLSPALHTAAYTALGLHDWSYEMHECDEAGLPRFVAGLDHAWAGLSLTMPLKRVALEVADEVSPLATATGAANTLVPRHGRWFAHNTDVAGLVAALAGAGVGEGGATLRAVVLGAGGTAQASLAALRELGVPDVDVLVRSVERAGELRAAADRLGVSPTVTATLADPPRATAAITGADVVISTLPAGAADALAGAGPGTVLLDVVYAPWPTRFAATAAAAGAQVVSGLEMLLHQAVAQVELMTGHPGPVSEMRSALDEAVAART